VGDEQAMQLHGRAAAFGEHVGRKGGRLVDRIGGQGSSDFFLPGEIIIN